VHGAGETPAVWDGWEGTAIDLQAGLNVEAASMLNYEAVVACDALLQARPLCVVGRGMGALAVLMAARRVLPEALVLVEAWPPDGLSGELAPGGERLESPLALDECRRGISVPPPEAPTLVVGSPGVAELYSAEELDAPASPEAVLAWARSASASAT
jgi:hypothetical protein